MTFSSSTRFFLSRLKALHDPGALFLIVLGLVLFALRLPFAADGFLNMPVIATVIQTAGLMFTIAGFQVVISRLVWPGLSFTALTKQAAYNSNMSAALVVLGLFLYNGLSTVAFVIWLSSALGAGIGVR